jgi:hypothetical protein
LGDWLFSQDVFILLVLNFHRHNLHGGYARARKKQTHQDKNVDEKEADYDSRNTIESMAYLVFEHGSSLVQR